MNKTIHLATRELAGLFYSPIGYLVLALYLLLMGFIFGVFVFQPGQVADMRPLIQVAHYVMILVAPILTMGALSDEYASGRIEMLRTSPISEWQIVLSKYLGILGFYAVMLATTLVYVIILMILGRLDMGTVFSGYLSLLLVGAMFIAIGLFFSAITPYQVVAAMSSLIALLIMGFLLDRIASYYVPLWYPPSDALSRGVNAIVRYMSIYPRMDDFAKGVIETTHVAFFAIFSGLFLLLTYLVVESRKWR